MIRAAFLACAAVLALTNCNDPAQIATGVKTDTAPFQGTGKPFVSGGWKAGDRNSWEQQLKTRTQNGQNDYAKVN